VETISTITTSVNDLAFAPSLGRSYSVLAVASKDLRIVTLKLNPNANVIANIEHHARAGTEVGTEAGEGHSNKYEVHFRSCKCNDNYEFHYSFWLQFMY
jgi:hypothetical protein